MRDWLTKWLRWIFWRIVYAFLPPPKGWEIGIIRSTRTRRPRRKFRPGVLRHEDGGMWQVWLKEERDYTLSRRQLQVELHMTEAGKIVGFNVWDECLRAAEAKENACEDVTTANA